jgi:hypothetical protein
VHMPQGISKLSLVLHFSIWATEGPRKNRPLSAVLFWQISATICVCLSIAFFLSSFDHRAFEEVATVVYALYVVFLTWNLNQKGWFTIMLMLTLLIELCKVLYERKFSSVGNGEWWDEMKYGQKLKLGDAPEAPLLHRQKSSPLSTHYIFIASCTMRFSWSVFTFAFSFLLFCLL